MNVFNLFDREVSDIDYHYPSRLTSELGDPARAAGVNDIHFHPVEPRTFRVSVLARL